MSENEPTKKKNMVIAIILSLLVPGMGQIYTDRLQIGVALILINFGLNVLVLLSKDQGLDVSKASMELSGSASFHNFYMLAGIIVWGLALIDTKLTVDKINREIEEGELKG